MPGTLPTYVERTGRQVWRPPYRADAAQVVGLVVPADQQRLDALLQRDLVLPSGGALDYRSAHASVIVTFASIGRMCSGETPDSLRGYLPEKELSIWVLVADKTAGERLCWYLPYVFTDSGQTVATGREVYGYPKQIAAFDQAFPDGLLKGGDTTVSALTIETFDPASCAYQRPVATVARKSGPGTAPPPPGKTWAEELLSWFPGGLSVDVDLPVTLSKAAAAIITTTTGKPGGPGAPPPWLKPMLASLQGQPLTGDPDELAAAMLKNPTLVFLKQFRDAQCETKACYQAVIEAPIAVDPTNASFTPLDPAQFSVKLENWASHPIASDLGIPAATAVTPTRAFQASFSFGIQTGYEVWKAPT